MKIAPASRNSCQADFPLGAFASGSGMTLNMIGNTCLPLIDKACAFVITTLLSDAFATEALLPMQTTQASTPMSSQLSIIQIIPIAEPPGSPLNEGL
jgi:hypothetical protein